MSQLDRDYARELQALRDQQVRNQKNGGLVLILIALAVFWTVTVIGLVGFLR